MGDYARMGRLNTAARDAISTRENVSDKWTCDSNPYEGLDPVYLALSRLRRRKFDESIAVSTELLGRNAVDQQVWWIKCRALTQKNYIDDTEAEEEGLGDMLLDDNATSSLPRPGTSLARPSTANISGPSPAVRPMSNGGRPLSGFVRPGTGGQRPASPDREVKSAICLRACYEMAGTDKRVRYSRVGTAMTRPVTTSGRFVRLGTASLQSEPGGAFVNLERLNLQKYAERPSLAKALCDYILFAEHKPRKALELCAAATQVQHFKDWWWKMRLGKAYYQLGMLRDAEQQYSSSLRDQEMVSTTLQLANIYIRLDQPQKALEVYKKATENFPHETMLLVAAARVHDQLNQADEGVVLYKQVLALEASNVESLACLASYQFYSDQPEIALRYYRRLLQMGVGGGSIWNNLGLCCFYSGQYDMCLTCFERALELADEETQGDVWYNVSQLAIGIGDLGLAYQALKVALAASPQHVEATNNLAVLELKKGNLETARSGFREANSLGPHSFEPSFNCALLAFKVGDLQESFKMVNSSLEAFADHAESAELLDTLKSRFT